MQLDRHFTNAEVERDLLVDASARHFMQNLALAWRQRPKAFDVALDDYGLRPPRGIYRNACNHSAKQRLIPHWLGEKVHGAGLHRLDGHRNVGVAGQEDDWLEIAFLGQMMLQIKTARSWHANIKDNATGAVQYISVQKFASRGKADRLETR